MFMLVFAFELVEMGVVLYISLYATSLSLGVMCLLCMFLNVSLMSTVLCSLAHFIL